MKQIYQYLCVAVITFSAAPVFAQSNTKEINYEGLKIIYKKTQKEVITASFFVKGGTANVSEEQQGIEYLALLLAMQGGTKKMNKDVFAAKAERMGTTFSASSAKDYSSATMTCLTDAWEESWPMFVDALMNPAMDENEFNVIKAQAIAGAKQQDENPDAYLRKVATKGLFGGTDYAKIPTGTTTTLESIKLEDVKNYFSTLLGKKRSYLVVVGNVEESNLLNHVKTTLAKLPAGPDPKKPSFKSITAPGSTVTDREIATNYILGTLNAPKYFSEDGPLFEFAMSILYDRYFVELRTKRSLSYAPSAYYSKGTIQQPTANIYITTIDPKQSIQVMTDIINDVRKNGFTEKEVKDKKKEYLTDYYMTNEASASQANQLGFCEASGNWRLFDEINSKIGTVKTSDLNRTFGKYMNTIVWNYLGKEDKVTKEDFKQLAPATDKKLPPSKVAPTKKG